MPSIQRLFPVSFALVASLGLVLDPGLAAAGQFDDDEQSFQALYLATPVELLGRVVDEQGLAIEGAQLQLLGFGEGLINDGEATTSWVDGSFALAGLGRRSALLELRAPGYYTEIIAVDLQVDIAEAQVDLGDLRMVAEQLGRARVTFAGDAMFGRRFFDRDGDGVLGESGDLLHLDGGYAGLQDDTRALFQYVEPVLHADDHTAINLENSVTDNPDTPHPLASYIFHTYTASASVLPELGVDSVSLGNNHIFDYLDQGVIDTLDNLDAIGLPYYGAGLTRGDAAASTYRPDLNGVGLALQGFSNLTGSSYGQTSLRIIAYDDPAKPGALPSWTSELEGFVASELGGGRLIVPIVHGGSEYSDFQSSGTRGDFERLVEAGADLVIAHHPHVVHGISTYDAGNGKGPVYVVGSLGNFVFDQNIFETLRSYLAVVDVVDGPGGPAVEAMQLVPIRLDDYVPRMLTGDALAKLGRHVAHLSTSEAAAEPADSKFGGAAVYAAGGRLHVALDESALVTTDLLDARNVALVGGSTGPIALEPFTANDALAELSSPGVAASCELGRDLLTVGDFEDDDVDAEFLEGDLWEQSSSRYIQGSEVRSGTGAAVLLRSSSNSGRTSLWMGKTIDVVPGRKFSVHGWHKGDNAGEFRVTVRWMTAGGSTISHTTQYQQFASNYDWSPFTINLTVPSNAYNVQVYFRAYPMASGEGQVYLDDVAFIDWDPTALAVGPAGVELATPNGWDFVRCAAPGASLDLTLTHRVYE